MTHLIRTVDAHVGGQSLRLLVDGAPRPAGRTIAQKAAWLRRHADNIRKGLVCEPRGHRDLTAAQLTEPAVPGAHAGVIFMGISGYPAMSGHGVMAVATIAIERELFFSRDAGDAEVRLAFDTSAGTIHTRCRVEARDGSPRVTNVAFTCVPAFVQAPGRLVRIGSRELRVDVAAAGLVYAIVDTEAVGIPLTGDRLPELRRIAGDIIDAVASAPRVESMPDAPEIVPSGVVFTGPPQHPDSHLRTITVTEGGAVDRSPGGTSMIAVMTVLDAMGLLPDDGPFVQEGVAGSLFRGRVLSRTIVGGRPAIVAEVEGSAWITGEHTFVVHDDDPFREGFTL